MIKKVMPITYNTKFPVRSLLQKNSSKLKNLSGSSMSNWHGPTLKPTEMVIPGGLNFQEKAYYLLTGKMPNSVYERWTENATNYIPQKGDEIVTVNMDGRYIGDVVEGPHDIITGEAVSDSIPTGELGTQILGSEGVDVVGADISDNPEDTLSIFEIWKHLAGMQ